MSSHKRSSSAAPLLSRSGQTLTVSVSPASRPQHPRWRRPAVVLPLLALLTFGLTLLPFWDRVMPPRHAAPGPPQVPLPAPPGAGGRVRVGTWNLRFDGLRDRTVPVGLPGDGSERDKVDMDGDGYGERPWAERRWRVLDTILQHKYDIIGFQEAFKSQVDDLQALLGDGWSWVGVGRDDGFQQGEYAPIFYNSEAFEEISHEFVWLSPTPAVPGSKGWDASQPRIATLLTLRSKTTADILHVVNTHWDDQGVLAREMSGRLLRTLLPETARRVERAKKIGDGETLEGAVLLIGDLNSPAEEQGYQALTNSTLLPLSSASPAFLPTPAFHDTVALLPLRPPSFSPPLSHAQQKTPHLPFGPWDTYTGFERRTRRTRIDFVFLLDESFAGRKEGGKGAWVVDEYAVIDNWVDGDQTGWKGRVSDHRAVLVEIVKV